MGGALEPKGSQLGRSQAKQQGEWSGPGKEKGELEGIKNYNAAFIDLMLANAGHLLRAPWHYFIQSSHNPE